MFFLEDSPNNVLSYTLRYIHYYILKCIVPCPHSTFEMIKKLCEPCVSYGEELGSIPSGLGLHAWLTKNINHKSCLFVLKELFSVHSEKVVVVQNFSTIVILMSLTECPGWLNCESTTLWMLGFSLCRSTVDTTTKVGSILVRMGKRVDGVRWR